jgi:hypothetical protein
LTRIAWVDNIPDGLSSIIATTSNTELKGFMDETSNTATAKVTLDQALTTAITIKATLKYTVVVGAL